MVNRGAQGSLAEIPQFHPRVQSPILVIIPGTLLILAGGKQCHRQPPMPTTVPILIPKYVLILTILPPPTPHILHPTHAENNISPHASTERLSEEAA